MVKRDVDIVIISDVHLGTYGCQANQLLEYLANINPKILVLNGDIIDIWNFSKSYFPVSHLKVIRQIIKMTETGTETYYITGNHDEALRRYSGTRLGNLVLDDKLVLKINGKKIWIFHGDIFDSSIKGWTKVLAKLGGKGYDLLILLNSFINKILLAIGKERVSLSKRVKNSVKKAVKWINDFEDIAIDLAKQHMYDTVICGHIHHPQDKIVQRGNKNIRYLNSGDWVENCTALEYFNNDWHLYKHQAQTIRAEKNNTENENNWIELKKFSLSSVYNFSSIKKTTH